MSVMNASAAPAAAGPPSTDGPHRGAGPADAREPRVRELAREAMALMVFSAAVSVAMAVSLLIAYGIGH